MFKYIKMKKVHLVILFLLICSVSAKLFAQDPPTNNSNKLVLPSFVILDQELESATANICEYIYKKKGGFRWPITKITFCRQDTDNILIDVTAIDNSWFKLFDPREDVYGYFIVNNRMFVVASKGNEDVNLNAFFEVENETRKFDISTISAPVFNNPTWFFQYKDNKMTLLRSENLEVLDK